MRYRAFLFDLDGTLVDSHREITSALQRALAEFEVVLPFDEAGPMVDGRPLEHIWEVRVGPLLGAAARARGFAAFADAYRRQYMLDLGCDTAAYEGVVLALTALRAHASRPKLAVVSNKAQPSVLPLLTRCGLDHLFDAALGAGGSGHAPKPSPALLLHAAEVLGVAPEDCVMVGDTELDIAAGKAANMCTVALTHGMGSHAELSSADFVISRFSELNALFFQDFSA